MKEFFSISLGIFFFANIVFLQFFMRYRIRRLRFYCDQFRQEGLLSPFEYEILINRYRNVFKYLEWFPEKADYPQLYLNKDFNTFSKRAKIISIYLAISMLIVIVLCNLMI